jgi:hypothetical protein
MKIFVINKNNQYPITTRVDKKLKNAKTIAKLITKSVIFLKVKL